MFPAVGHTSVTVHPFATIWVGTVVDATAGVAYSVTLRLVGLVAAEYAVPQNSQSAFERAHTMCSAQ
jgi:hypothetical protein